MASEKKKWKMRKNAEEWRYKKLMSAEAEEYHEKEKQLVSKFQSENNRKLFKQHKGNLKCTSMLVSNRILPRQKLKKRAE